MRIKLSPTVIFFLTFAGSLFAQVSYVNPIGTALESSHGIFYDQYLGTRFDLSTGLNASSITADFTSGNNRDLFVAIVALDHLSAFPTASSTVGLDDLDEVVFSTLFNPGAITLGELTTISIPVEVQLSPGSYAIVFGSGLFGSPVGPPHVGGASASFQNYNLITGSDTIAWTAPSQTWSGPQYDLIAGGTPTYGISISGTPITAIPEHSSIGLGFGAIGIAVAAAMRRRRLSHLIR